LVFSFDENDFFTNKTLEKSYYLINSPDAGHGMFPFFSFFNYTKMFFNSLTCDDINVKFIGDIVFDRAEGTEIKWKEGKDLTVSIEIKKQRHKGKPLLSSPPSFKQTLPLYERKHSNSSSIRKKTFKLFLYTKENIQTLPLYERKQVDEFVNV
jgi:hypothetical protein